MFYLCLGIAMNEVNSAVAGGPPPPNLLAGANIVKEGWLYKRGEHIKNWRARYV